MSAPDPSHTPLTPDDIAFLTSLANALKTQDTASTAKPVIYQILQRKREIGIDPDYSDGIVLSLGDDHEEFDNQDVDRARAWLLEEFAWSPEELERITSASCLEDFADFCEESGRVNYRFTGYRNIETYSGFFLTQRALLDHVQHNGHHYQHPVSYAQAAGWRNPELERLLRIVEQFASSDSAATANPAD